jgi:hypothetical protein
MVYLQTFGHVVIKLLLKKNKHNTEKRILFSAELYRM